MSTVERPAVDAWLLSTDRFISEVVESGPITDFSVEEVRYRRSCQLAKRFRLVLFDLDLSRVVPETWASPRHGGLAFEELGLREADRLVRSLEHLSQGRRPRAPRPGPGQGRLF